MNHRYQAAFKKAITLSLLLFCTMVSFAQIIGWTQKKPLGLGANPRSDAVAFTIGNKAYVGTGFSLTLGTRLLDLWVYDPVTDSWSQVASAPEGRSEGIGMSIGNKGYVGLGRSQTTVHNKNMWEYDPAANTWTRKADFPGEARSDAACFSIGSKGYVGTGSSSSGPGPLKDFWEFDPAANTWTRKADLAGDSRSAATGFTIGSKGYIATGYRSGSSLNDLWEYEPGTDSWIQKASVGTSGRYDATSFVAGLKAYVGTGMNTEPGSVIMKDLWEYDQGSDTWTRKADLPEGKAAAVGFSLGQYGYIGTTSFSKYNLATNTWTNSAPLSSPMIPAATAFTIGTKGYIAGGRPGLKEFWEYDPASDSWAQKANYPGQGYMGHTGFGIGSKGYMGFGVTTSTNPYENYSLDFWEYDPALNTWLQKSSHPTVGRAWAVGFAIGSKGYVGTGQGGVNGSYVTYNDFWEYAPATNSWVQKANASPVSRAEAVGFSLNGKGYIGTGFQRNNFQGTRLKDFWEYDPVANTFTQKADFGGTPRENAAGFAMQGKGYIGLGQNTQFKYVRDFWFYDPATNVWTETQSLPSTPRINAAGFSINNIGYIAMGRDSLTTLNQIWAAQTCDPPPQPGAIEGITVVCPGVPQTYTVQPVNGATSYIWTLPFGWTGTSTTNSITGTPGNPGTIQVAAVNSCGTGITQSLAISYLGLVLTYPGNMSFCPGGSFTITANVLPGYSYQWFNNGSPISGANSSTFTTTTPGSFTVLVSGSNCTLQSSSPIHVSMLSATAIIAQPQPLVRCLGGSATFSVTVSGSIQGLQWRKDGVNIPGAISTTYNINNLVQTDAGSYDVVVSGSCGNLTSAPATLTVNAGTTSITTQPQAQVHCAGGSATFSVAASGSSLGYQWRKDGVNISGATSGSFTLNNLVQADAGNYDVVVSGACGNLTSTPAALTINAATSITTHPQSRSVCANTGTSFTVAASGANLTYQWRKDGVNIPNATAATYAISATTAADAGNYDVVVSGTCGSLTSTPAVLTVNAVTAITAQPQALVRCSGGSATFSVTASGANLAYQWRKDGVNISGATSGSFTINSLVQTDAGSYDVVVSGTCGSQTSAPAPLTVNAATSVTTQPQAQTVCANTGTSFTVAASGTNVTYQWRKDGVNIPNATAATYTLASTTAADAGNYDAVVSGSCGSVTSNAAKLTVDLCTAIIDVIPGISSIVLMPNMVRGEALLRIESLSASRLDLEIVDANGRRIELIGKKLYTGRNEFILSFAGLAPGHYFLKLVTPAGTSVLKFVKL
jgi:N-acetylneuraminic acid mutarotase